MRLAQSMRYMTVAGVFACATTLMADFRYEETTKVTGGTILRLSKFPGMGKMTAPTTTVHYFKGGKSANATGNTVDIIDADRGVFIVVNKEDKTYSTITFEEFKAALEAMSKKAQQQAKGAEGSMTIDMKVNDLGTTRRVLNLDAKGMEMKLTMTMTDKKSGQSVPMDITSELYIVKELAGSEEMKQFYLRMAKKIDWDVKNARFMGLAQMQPGFAEGMQKMAAEARKLEGTPLVTITKMMGMPGGGEMPEMPEMNGPSSTEISDAAAREARSEATREASSQTSRAAGGRFGGLAGAAAGGMLGGFGRKKPKEQPKEEVKAQTTPAPAPAPKSFMETTSEVLSYSSSAIDGSLFEVPAGFKEVEHPMKKAAREAAK